MLTQQNTSHMIYYNVHKIRIILALEGNSMHFYYTNQSAMRTTSLGEPTTHQVNWAK